MKDYKNAQSGTASVMAAIARVFKTRGGNRALRETLDELRGRPRIAAPNQAKLEDHRQTAGLILHILKMIGGDRFQARVLRAAKMPNDVGDWQTSHYETARAYQSIHSALLTTTAKKEVLGLVQNPVSLAANSPE